MTPGKHQLFFKFLFYRKISLMYVKSWTKSILGCIRPPSLQLTLLQDLFVIHIFKITSKWCFFPSVPLPLSLKMNTPLHFFLKLQKFLLKMLQELLFPNNKSLHSNLGAHFFHRNQRKKRQQLHLGHRCSCSFCGFRYLSWSFSLKNDHQDDRG